MTQSPLDLIPFVNNTRRNHALEHATMQVLSQRFSGVKMAGISTPAGFFLVADLPTEIITDAVIQASKRLMAGESNLAIHPNCGTNLATSSLLAGSVAWLVLGAGSAKGKPKWGHYFLAVMLAVPIFLLSKPLGLKVQKTLTTNADLGDIQVKMITSQKTRKGYIHQIQTGPSSI